MAITFIIRAYTLPDSDAAGFFQVSAYATDYAASNAETRAAGKAAAAEIVAQFPKSVGLVATTCTRHEGTAEVCGYVSMSAKLATDGVNGGKNETGIKRYRSLRKHLARLGHTVEYRADASNSYRTLEAFEAAL